MPSRERGQEPKAGILTSEFFVAVGIIVIAAVLAVTDVISPEQWEEVTKWSGGGYIVSRGIAKFNS